MMDSETAEYVLKHALPPGARAERWRRTFNVRDRSDLLNAGCDDAQIERLQRILPAIAYYNDTGAKLGDVRAVLAAAQKALDRATRSVLSILDAPAHDQARDEARAWLLTSTLKLFADRCQPDAQRASFFERHDERADELRRLLAAVADLQAVAKQSLDRLAKAPQSRPVSPAYPITLIVAALSVDGPSFRASERKGTRFERIAARCYKVADADSDSPTRAIRAWLATSTAAPAKKLTSR